MPLCCQGDVAKIQKPPFQPAPSPTTSPPTPPHPRADLKYDVQTGLVEPIPLGGNPQDEEHVERQSPTEDQRTGPPSETEVKSVEKGHEHVMHNASQLDIANAAVLAVEQQALGEERGG
jgi:hypothetical protein